MNENTFCVNADCEIQCSGSISCFGSNLYCNSDTCNINCANEYSCTNTKIYSDIDNGTIQMSVLCNDNLACSNSFMQIHDVEEFKLVCVTSAACQGTIVNISGYNDFSEIYCNEFGFFLHLHYLVCF